MHTTAKPIIKAAPRQEPVNQSEAAIRARAPRGELNNAQLGSLIAAGQLIELYVRFLPSGGIEFCSSGDSSSAWPCHATLLFLPSGGSIGPINKLHRAPGQAHYCTRDRLESKET